MEQNDIVLVTPGADFTIVNELTFRPLPKEGARVRLSSYYLRLEAEGAITITEIKPEVEPDVEPVPEPEPAPSPEPSPTPPAPNNRKK